MIADDLTGAMDTGLQFAQQGIETLVAMDPAAEPVAPVVAYTTESRELAPSQAIARMRALLPLVHGKRIYKKVDSTLRGNIGYELRVLAGLPTVHGIVVCPAFPDGGRIVVAGELSVHGRPLALTEFRHDPRWPMHESHVPTLLMQQAGMEVGQVGLDVVARGPQALAEALRRQRARLVVADATSKDDLEHIAAALHLLGPGWVPCGCAGLARPWAARLAVTPRGPVPAFAPSDRGALFVCGSRNPVTVRQMERLARAGVPTIRLDAQGSYEPEREAARLAQAVCATLGRRQDVLLEASTAPLLPGAGPRIAGILASATEAAVREGLLGGLFVTGGDVAIAVCQRLGVLALRLAAEIQPGLPGAQLIGGPGDGLPVATKAGGFGDDDALLDVRRWLAAARQGGAPS